MMTLSNLNQFKKDLLNQAPNTETQIYLEDMFCGNLKETSAFTMVFDDISFMNELKQLDKNLYLWASNWIIK